MEFEASLQYLLMAAQFSQDTYNLPGVAKLFWDHADGERACKAIHWIFETARLTGERFLRWLPNQAHPR